MTLWHPSEVFVPEVELKRKSQKILLASVIFALSLGDACQSEPSLEPEGELAPIDWVDPFIGTGGGGYAQAQCFVGATRPFGMAKPGPDSSGPLLGRTGFAHSSGYWSLDDHIDGLSQLHLHGTGAEDFGNFLLMPSDAALSPGTREDGYKQWFRHSIETASPGYYAVHLEDADVDVELTASTHAAFHRYHFAADAQPMLVVDFGHGLGRDGGPQSEIALVENGATLSGKMIAAGRFTGEERSYPVWVSAQISPPPSTAQLYVDGALIEDGLQGGAGQAQGIRSGAFLYFAEGTREVTVQLGMSYVDAEQAATNRAEIEGLSFDQVHQEARDVWSSMLDRVHVEGGRDDDKTIFYTALYHSMMMPTQMSEVGGFYRGLDRQVHQAEGFYYHSDFSMWDSYRTLHPLLNLIAPDKQQDLARSLLAMADQYGAPPRWPLAVNESGSMLGSPAAIILVESLLKGLDLDAAEVLDVLVADADLLEGHSIRHDFAPCIELGFCPADEVGDSVSKTLEYAWADFAISALAKNQGETDLANRFAQRALGYRGLWDAQTQFLRGRNRDGTWAQEPFDPLEFSDDYTEGNAWQYLWAAPFDVVGLVEMFGGVEPMLSKLDDFFRLAKETPRPMPIEPFAGYDSYYWHGNEPDIHAAYLYALAGQPQRGFAQIDWVRRTKYGTGPDGLDGNDDAGTLSAWYVFSALGLYPLAGSDLYIVGTPLFPRAVLHLPTGDLEIVAPEVDAQHIYVKSLSLNGQALTRPFVHHADLLGGAVLRFEMSASPTTWGQGEVLDLFAD